jgi:pectate lyase
MKKIKVLLMAFASLQLLFSCTAVTGNSSSLASAPSASSAASVSPAETSASASDLTSSVPVISAGNTTSEAASSLTSPALTSVPVSSSVSSSVSPSVSSAGEKVSLTKAIGARESCYLAWDNLSGASAYAVYYKKHADSAFIKADDGIISLGSASSSAHVVGLAAGAYDVKVVPVLSGGEASDRGAEKDSLAVTAFDRSGYAHFNYSSGIGAYNDDGTLKSGAKVIYVDNTNKNTVTCSLGGTSYTGLVAILQAWKKNASQITEPLDVRIKGTISTNQFAKPSITTIGAKISATCVYATPAYYENKLETKYPTNLTGLTCSLWGSSDAKAYYDKTAANVGTAYAMKFNSITDETSTDSYFNMCDVNSASQVTVEGMGTDAVLEQWGFTWSKCHSIEVRNLTFQNYVEDACSFQGGGNSDMDYKNFWLHSCRFNRGLNNWDLTWEQDKGDGDGGFDIKYLENITSSENIFYNCHKTGLIGGSDSAYTMNVTFHHNHYWKCSARLPLGRQANMHFFNNYYDSCTTCQDIRAKAYCFSEANYFSSCSYPQKISSNAVIKSYGDLLSSCGSSAATAVTSRTSELTNSCKPDGSTDCSSFTTDASLFYYDAVNKITKATNLLPASAVKNYVLEYAGPLIA